MREETHSCFHFKWIGRTGKIYHRQENREKPAQLLTVACDSAWRIRIPRSSRPSKSASICQFFASDIHHHVHRSTMNAKWWHQNRFAELIYPWGTRVLSSTQGRKQLKTRGKKAREMGQISHMHFRPAPRTLQQPSKGWEGGRKAENNPIRVIRVFTECTSRPPKGWRWGSSAERDILESTKLELGLEKKENFLETKNRQTKTGRRAESRWRFLRV